MKNFSYLRPADLEQASSMLAGQDAQALGGGTDLLDLMKSEIATPERVVNLKSIRDPQLRAIEERGEVLRIGALVTLHELATSSLLRERYTVLQQAAAASASPQLRHAGTLGGNLGQRPRCWYFRDEDFDCLRKGGDSCFALGGRNKYHCVVGGGPCVIVHPSDPAVALTALDATVIVHEGKRSRSVPIGEFFVLPDEDVTRETVLRPGEVIAAVELPVPPAGTRSGYTKFKVRQTWDFALVSVAATLHRSGGRVDGGRIALGGVAPVPWLEKNATSRLQGLRPGEEALRELGEAVLRDASPLEENEYKVPLARNLVRRQVRELMTA